MDLSDGGLGYWFWLWLSGYILENSWYQMYQVSKRSDRGGLILVRKRKSERKGGDGWGQLYSISSKILAIMEYLSGREERKRKGKNTP